VRDDTEISDELRIHVYFFAVRNRLKRDYLQPPVASFKPSSVP
jgi:hypothetical protein